MKVKSTYRTGIDCSNKRGHLSISTIWLSIGLLQSEEFLARSGWPYFVEDGCEKKSPAG